MCGEFGEVTVIIGLVINFLAFVPPFVSFRDTLSYGFDPRRKTLGIGQAQTCKKQKKIAVGFF